MPTALALSPHLDDAAFSCGGLLASLAQAGWRVVMATVFTGSVADPTGFALACQLDKGLPTTVDYMALRRDEDVRAAAALGIAPPRHLPFREAPHRGYGSPPELFADTRAEDGIAADLAPALAGLIAAESPDLILAPQAIGGHVDHVQAVRALRSLDIRGPILWWRDFPYTVREAAPKQPLAGLFADLPAPLMTLEAAARERKRAACAAYASQIGFQFGGASGLDARLAREEGIERFRLSGLLDAAIPGLDPGLDPLSIRAAMPAEPRAPKSLADPDALAARRALIGAAHIAPIRALAERIAAERGAPVPLPDPLDGGTGARLLLLLETPGPAVLRTGFVTRDSANGTAANLFGFLAGAGIARADTLIWNAVPWLIHQEGARNRAPRRAEVAAAAPYLGPLLDLLPRLAVAVLAGRFAGEAAPALAALRPGLPVIRVPHPSPTYVCTAPEVPARIRTGLSEAAGILARASA